MDFPVDTVGCLIIIYMCCDELLALRQSVYLKVMTHLGNGFC